jgi:2-polyprenyl-3-methyl-5-hydroxy-6-metoxy-1,4-benzoquinol methylase
LDNKEHRFLQYTDDTARLINDRANHLYRKLCVLDICNTEIDEFGKYYFNSHHGGKRLFFSVQSSAQIIYHSVKKLGRPVNELNFIDYGAGLGTLFLLAGAVGFKNTYFNDYFPQWAGYAKIISDELGIHIKDYISGDIDAVIGYGSREQVHFDILASRNVVEHIYKLRDFYGRLHDSGITTFCYSTTTANYHNFAMRLKHYLHHYRTERNAFKEQRAALIRELVPAVSEKDLHSLVEITRGRAFDDFNHAVQLYLQKQPVPPVASLRTNTCDCRTGVWAENLLTRNEYRDIIEGAGFRMEYSAGFWDTNYRYKVVNLVTACLNGVIKLLGKKGYWIAPFVNITARK